MLIGRFSSQWFPVSWAEGRVPYHSAHNPCMEGNDSHVHFG